MRPQPNLPKVLDSTLGLRVPMARRTHHEIKAGHQPHELALMLLGTVLSMTVQAEEAAPSLSLYGRLRLCGQDAFTGNGLVGLSHMAPTWLIH